MSETVGRRSKFLHLHISCGASRRAFYQLCRFRQRIAAVWSWSNQLIEKRWELQSGRSTHP